MEFKRLDKRKGSGAASIRSRYAYLIHLPDIDYFPETNEKGVRLEGDIVLKDGRTMIPVYLTNPSQEYSYDTPGNDDEKTFLVKFVGTHPGTELEALEFSKNLLEEPFLVLIPGCEKNAPGKLLGQPNNPMIFTSTHKASKDGDKFNFNFEQRVGSEYIYFSYGGIISLPPGGDDPDIPVPPSPGFDPTKWARRDASNIDGDNVLLWREALRIYDEVRNFTQHGPITTTSSSVTIGLSPLGENFAIIDGVKYIEPTTNPETPKLFTPVSPGKLKELIIQALPDAEVFHLVEGIEGNEAVRPDYTGIFVASIIVNDSGKIVIENNDDSFKLKSDDTVYPIIINNETGIWVYARYNTFEVLSNSIATTPTLFGLIGDGVNAMVWNGKKIFIKNSSGKNVTLKKEPTPPIVGDKVYFSFSKNITLKDGETAVVFLNSSNELELLKFVGGGGASFPEGGATGNVLEFDAVDGAKWSNRLTNVENRTSNVVDKALHYWDATAGKWISSGVTWISDKVLKLKSLIFENYTITQRDAITNLEEGRLIYVNDTTFKGFQKYENGSWVEISNSKLDLKQIEISSNTTASNAWAGRLILVTASCTITIPASLQEFWACEIRVMSGATLTFAITSPKTFPEGAPPPITGVWILHVMQRGSSNNIYISGL